MCVGPTIGAGTPQPKPAAKQTSEGIAEVAAPMWRMLAEKQSKIRSTPAPLFPTIVKK